jgi:hypothetical protein
VALKWWSQLLWRSTKRILLILYCETLLCSERWRFIPRGILSLGALDQRDVPGRGVLWVLGGVVLKLAQDI